ncbi:MAG: single-stranded DNA-binding protein [Erysipelotrichaceae bacterium]|nr:single-stranded DNA-binding protein [Erysipelotrichaceae bacterium]
MLNQVIMIGKVSSFPQRNEKDFVLASFTMEVERPYCEPDGSHRIDVFPVVLWRGVADVISEKHHLGEVVAVKGRLEMNNGIMEIIAERVSFITSQSASDEEA